MADYDAIVVGAGHNRLAAASVLASQGVRVLCLERTNGPGGMAATKALSNLMAERVIDQIAKYAPNFRGAIMDRAVLTHQYFKAAFGVTAGDFSSGLLHPGQMWDRRPVPGWANYRTPLRNLYMCGSACHPGPGITCVPGYNGAHAALEDMARVGTAAKEAVG